MSANIPTLRLVLRSGELLSIFIKTPCFCLFIGHSLRESTKQRLFDSCFVCWKAKFSQQNIVNFVWGVTLSGIHRVDSFCSSASNWSRVIPPMATGEGMEAGRSKGKRFSRRTDLMNRLITVEESSPSAEQIASNLCLSVSSTGIVMVIIAKRITSEVRHSGRPVYRAQRFR